MRKGAEFITRPGVRNINMRYIIARLNRCADLYDNCLDCPDLKVCRNAYDSRCGLREKNYYPILEGGGDEPDNLITSCYACNRGKNSLSIIRRRSSASVKAFVPPQPQSWRRDETLNFITNNPGLSTNELASQLDLARGNMDVILSRLKRIELIKREDKKWFPT